MGVAYCCVVDWGGQSSCKVSGTREGCLMGSLTPLDCFPIVFLRQNLM